MNRKRAGSSPSPPPPPPSAARPNRSGTNRSNHTKREYPRSRSPRRSREVKLQLCLLSTTSHKWHTAPVRFDPTKINDRQLWSDIRYTFRQDLQKPWRRIFGFMKVKTIVPIGYTQNGVPTRTDPKDYPDSRSFMHAYHHPEEIRTKTLWVHWFEDFDNNDERTNGLEFVEGLWADKLAVFAIIATVAMIAVSIIWAALGGVLQTVFTVMSFVLTLVAALIALAALYYQVALSA